MLQPLGVPSLSVFLSWNAFVLQRDECSNLLTRSLSKSVVHQMPHFLVLFNEVHEKMDIIVGVTRTTFGAQYEV
jgi:hypothetical protein